MPPRSIPSTSTSGPPTMKSVCSADWLTPSSSSAVGIEAVGALDAPGHAAAPGDVAGGVLVEQRREERDPGAADARLAVDERDLAEVRRALVHGDLRADDLGRRRRRAPRRCGPRRGGARGRARPSPGGRAAASTAPCRSRAGGRARSAPPPWACSRTNVRPAADSLRPMRQTRPGSSPTVRSVPGPAVAERVEAALGERARAGLEPVHVRAPGGDRVGLVEPDGRRDRVPEPLDVGLAEDDLGPARRREGRDRPVDPVARGSRAGAPRRARADGSARPGARRGRRSAAGSGRRRRR